MTWLKVDDGFAEHPKVLELDDATFRLHVRAMCWCSRQETDGAVTKAAQRALGAKPKQVATLVRVGLWDPTEDGHTIHDYLVYNPSKARLDAERAATRERVNRSRNAAGNGVTPQQRTPTVTPLPTPSVHPPRPVPLRSDLPDTAFQRPESLKPPDTPSAAEAAPNKPIPCPSDLRLLPGQTSSLEIAPGIPAESQEIMRSEFVAAELADPSKTMPLVAWRKCLSKAMCSRWSDPKRRPKPAESDPEDDGPKLPPGAGKRRLERMERERKEEIRRRAAEFEARGGKLPESIQALTEGIGG